MKQLRDITILIISPEPWQHNFISKHHYAIHLAQRGNRVFFLNPAAATTTTHSSGHQNLTIVDYNPFFRGLNRLPSSLANLLWKWEANRVRKVTGPIDLVWTFDPYRFQNLKHFAATTLIYFAADFHKNRALENMLADHADLVLAPSQALLDGIDTASKKIKINHAVARSFFAEARTQSLPGNNPIKIGYVGNLESRYLHKQLLMRVIHENPNCDFIFAGAEDGSYALDLRKFTHVFFKGLVPYDQLPVFLKSCDILLLCYDTNQFRMEASNAHKVMEYLSAGKAIVSTRLAEYESLPDLVIMPVNNEDLPRLLSGVMTHLDHHNSPSAQQRRMTFAMNNTYESQIKLIESLL